MIDDPGFRVGLMWSGDREARRNATRTVTRLSGVFEALAAVGIHAEPAVYADEFADEVRAQILQLDGVLVWVDPIVDGRNRSILDAMLRDVASRGVWVSTHPDVILKMGVKEVLHRTKHLGWGTDTHLYRDANELPHRVPGAATCGWTARAEAEPGQWRPGCVEGRTARRRRHDGPRAACAPRQRAGGPAAAEFLQRCEAYFADGGCIIDQPFQPRLPDGMIRCYMAARQSRGVRAPAHQGADSAAAGRPGLRRRRSLGRASCIRRMRRSSRR